MNPKKKKKSKKKKRKSLLQLWIFGIGNTWAELRRRRGSCDLGCAATVMQERGWAAKCDGARERGWATTVQRREGEIETWECEDLRVIFERGRDEWGLRVIEKWERVSKEWFWERAEQRRIGGKKKICWSCFRTTSFREKKKKKRSWATSFKGWKSQNRPNRSRFTELDSRTAVWTVPCFFCMERFLTLNRPWIWTVHGFSGLTVRSGPGSITLGLR